MFALPIMNISFIQSGQKAAARPRRPHAQKRASLVRARRPPFIRADYAN
jgi:hypothetical protein